MLLKEGVLVETTKKIIGTKRVICGLSGGVDSAVAAAIIQRAVGSQLTCVFVDHGLLRSGESEQVQRDFVASTGVNLVVVDAVDQFLQALDGVTDPETKRKIIGREFIRSFEKAARDIAAGGEVEFLVQGTLYPDVVESGGGTGTAGAMWPACRRLRRSARRSACGAPGHGAWRHSSGR